VGQLPDSLAAPQTPRAYPHPVETIYQVETIHLIETHISWVLVTGERVCKIKRPVRYPFIDMRALEQRRFLCHEELRLNKRFVPALYVDVVPITRGSDGGSRIGGQGEAIEYAVRMRQFDGRE
jgi:aminoglycoside phosphotransferase family enzyme